MTISNTKKNKRERERVGEGRSAVTRKEKKTRKRKGRERERVCKGPRVVACEVVSHLVLSRYTRPVSRSSCL